MLNTIGAINEMNAVNVINAVDANDTNIAISTANAIRITPAVTDTATLGK